jgi:hypothetical protein
MFDSKLLTLNDVIEDDYFFSIPIYQRLYVWGPEQIDILLSDIWQAYKEDNDVFYLGGTLAIEREIPDDAKFNFKLFDLIDGQQRFTTMWLISLVWGECLTEYQQKTAAGNDLHRISFAIRPTVKTFFDEILLNPDGANLPESPQLMNAIASIKSFKINLSTEDKAKFNLSVFTDFIRNKVKFVFTTVPKETDLNKLFEVINNRGVQLQHHEILKARLLQTIPVGEREAYGHMWDACSHMGNYLERNIRDAAGIKVSDLFNNEQSKQDQESLTDPDIVIAAIQQKMSSSSEEVPLGLLDILNGSGGDVKDEPNSSDIFEAEKVRSIISFSMLLQHTLRLFLFENERDDLDKILDKDLISLFDKHWLKTEGKSAPDSNEVMAFIRLLWKVRYLFDKYVIKWVDTDGEEVHGIRSLYNQKNDKSVTLSRSKESNSDFEMLQSMLYHSQQMTTHYWLTPLLNYLVLPDANNAEFYLQHLDNHLLNAFNEDSLIKRTRSFLEVPWRTNELRFGADALNKQLSDSFTNGTQYSHYWFYKLEYVLYVHLKHDSERKSWSEQFRMTAKNSVEHVAPQQSKIEEEKVSHTALHNFGNLALVTRSLNSEMSNRSFDEKKVAFIKYHHNKGTCLKLEYIYEQAKWTEDEIEDHREKMIILFDDYLNRVTKKVSELKVAL